MSPDARRRGAWIGVVLADRYRVESELGSGGMGAVYLATDQRLQRRVVVKVPHLSLLSEPGFRDRFAREVRSLTRLEHPNVVQIHDVGEHDGVPFAVVKYLGGGDLAQRLETTGTLTPDEILEWLPSVAATLDYVFASGFVHRDVKPENILFDEHGTVYLSDFGIATALIADDPDRTQIGSARLTQPGAFIGASTYAPPEALDRRLDRGYDQYSLAVTVYEALCGEVPFERGPWMDVMHAKKNGEPAPLEERAPELPPPACRAVMRALSRDADARFGSCSDFAHAFAAGLAAGPSRRRGGRPGRTLVAVVAGATVALLAALATTWWLARGTSAPRTLAFAAEGPVTFEAGSSPEEVEAAFALCERHVASCPDYASETLRSVTLAPFEIDANEVTNRDFAAFVERTGHRTTAEQRGFSYHLLRAARGWSWRAPAGPGSSWEERPHHPVVHVSWHDARAFCEATGGGMRLPSEDEWEYAVRGSERRVFPWGNAWADGVANWGRPRGGSTRAVGSYPDGSTPRGLADAVGNVAEWTSSGNERSRIYKGGSWFEANPANLRAAARRSEDPDYTASDLGFRCARDAR